MASELDTNKNWNLGVARNSFRPGAPVYGQSPLVRQATQWCCELFPHLGWLALESVQWKTHSLFVMSPSGWWFGSFFVFPYIGKNHPNWLSYFSEGLKPPTSHAIGGYWPLNTGNCHKKTSWRSLDMIVSKGHLTWLLVRETIPKFVSFQVGDVF